MNKKGFASSVIIYTIFAIFLVAISIMLFTVNNSVSLNKALNEETIKDIEYGDTNSELEERITALESKLLESTDKITELENSLTSSNSKVTKLESELSNSTKKTTELENKLTSSNSKITELENSLAESNKKITSSSSKITELESKLSNVKGEVLNETYPVGSIYISTIDDTVAKVKSKFGGEWKKYSEGRTLVGVGTVTDENGNALVYSSNQTGGNGLIKLSVANLPSHSHTISHTHTTPETTISSSGAHTHTTTSKSVTISSGLTAQSAGDHTHTFQVMGWPINGDGKTYHYSYADWHNTTETYSNSKVTTPKTGAHTHNVTGTITVPALSIASSGAHTHTVPSMTTDSISKSSSGNTGSGTAFNVINPYIAVYMYERIK